MEGRMEVHSREVWRGIQLIASPVPAFGQTPGEAGIAI
jgi:hypothetical protein